MELNANNVIIFPLRDEDVERRRRNEEIDKEVEGGMLFFPAKLQHTVYPFYNCDKERISISGNILFNISENSMKQYHSQMKENE